MAKESINGLDVFYDLAGAGQPLVLISGVSSDHAGFGKRRRSRTSPQRAFAACCSIIATLARPARVQLHRMRSGNSADDTAALIRKLDLGPSHIVGASMGGMIAQEMALNHADCVRSLTLVCTTPRPDLYMLNAIEVWKTESAKFTREEFLQARMPWIFTYRFYEKTEIAIAYRQRVLGNPYPQTAAAFQRQCDALIAHDALERLPAIHVPTHVVVGAEDLLIPSRHSKVLAERIPGARLTVVPDTGHCLFWETPAEFNRAVLDFLGAL